MVVGQSTIDALAPASNNCRRHQTFAIPTSFFTKAPVTDHTAPIIAHYNQTAGQWTAIFGGVPQFAFGGGTAIGAVRRLLEGAEASLGTYTIQYYTDSSSADQLPASVVWDPPELLVTCPDCNGRGEYVGLLHVEKCRTCGGRMVVPG